MANLIEGVFHTVEGILQSILAVVQAIFNVIYSVFHGLFVFVWGIIESLASFLGASVHFVASNILILGLVAVGVIVYQDQKKKGKLGTSGKKLQ